MIKKIKMDSNSIETIPEDDVVTSLVDVTPLKLAIRTLDVAAISEIIK